MNTMNNILSKIFLLLVLALGWGGSAWAERFTPAFEAEYNVSGHFYLISYWTNATYYKATGNGANLTYGALSATDQGQMWQLVGQQSSFKLVTKSGLYAKWNNSQYVATTNAAEATEFSLIDMQGSRTDYWGIHRTTSGNGQCWNPQGNLIKEYNNNDNNSSAKFSLPPTTIQVSDPPVGGSWAANTHWFTMRNERANSYMSTASAYYDTNGLKLRLSTNPTETSGFWCFVSDGAGKYYIYNYDAGPNKVLGTAYNGSDGSARTKMYEGTTTESGVGKHYEIGESSGGYWLRSTGPDGTNNWFIDGPTSGTYFTVWNNATAPKTSNGNRFFLYEAEVPYYEIPSSDYSFNPATGRIPTCQDFQLTLSAGSKTIVSCTELIAEGTNVPSVMPTLVSRARASITASSVTKGLAGVYTIHFDENIDSGDYTLEVPAGVFYVKDGDNVQKIATLSIDYQIVPPSATSGYKVIIKQADDDTNTYTVTTTDAVTTGRQYANNNEFLDLTTAPNLKDLQSLTINAPANKFVWGPVVDNTKKTITFEVRTAIKSLAELTDGFYQLQMTDQDNITKYNSIAKDFNTKSQYVYVAPWYKQSEYRDEYTNKYTGVPSYAGAPSTFYYLSKSGSNVRVQSIYGHYFSRLNTPYREPQNITSIDYNTTNNTLSFEGWTKEGYWTSNNSNGTEGPRAAAASGKMEHYHVSKVDLSDYDVYRVVIEEWAAGANIQSDPCVTYTGATENNLGLPTVYQNGYFFFKKDTQLTAENFQVTNVTIDNLDIAIEGTDEIKILRLMERQTEPADHGWQVIINKPEGDTNTYKAITTAAVNSGRRNALNGEFLDLVEAPTTTSVTLNTDREFVWGPFIDTDASTITFEVRTTASAFTAGRWYQLQMRNKAGQWFDLNASPNIQTGNMVDGVNGMRARTVRNAGSQIYAMNARTSGYPLELNGVVPADEVFYSYIYVPTVSGSNITLLSQNGSYVKNDGSGQASTTTVPLNYNASTHSFLWNAKTGPWAHTSTAGYITVGMTGSFAGSNNIELIAHPVKTGDDYNIYRVSVGEHFTVKYTGDKQVIVADGAQFYRGQKTATDGQYFFFPKDFTPGASDFTIENSVPTVDVTSGDVYNTLNLYLSLQNGMRFRFVDVKGDHIDGAVVYTDAEGVKHQLTSQTTFDFNDCIYRHEDFVAVGSMIIDNMVYNVSSKIITFTLKECPNILLFSSAPTGADWNADTKWYTWRNNRIGQAVDANLRYMTTSIGGVDNNYYLVAKEGVNPTYINDAGGAWCFVGNNTTGFEIYNKAYGPDFVFAHLGGDNFAMVNKNDKPDGARTTFTFGNNSTVIPEGTDVAYIFKIGTGNPNEHVHVTNGNLTNWDAGDSNRLGDTGSSFTVTRIDDEIIDALPKYDVYKVTDADVVYSGSSSKFGRRTGKPYLFVDKGSPMNIEEAYGPYASLVSGYTVAPLDGSSYIKTITAHKADDSKDYYRVVLQGNIPNEYHHLAGDGEWHSAAVAAASAAKHLPYSGDGRESYFVLATGAGFNSDNLHPQDASNVNIAYRSLTTLAEDDGLFKRTYGIVFPGYIVRRPSVFLQKAITENYTSETGFNISKDTKPYIDVKLKDGSTVKLQNTSVFEITHFLKPGEVRDVWMSPTSSSGNGESKINGYMCWYDYDTERLPDFNIFDFKASASNGNSLENTAKKFVNGYVMGSNSAHGGGRTQRFVRVTMPDHDKAAQADHAYNLAGDLSRWSDHKYNWSEGDAGALSASFSDPNGRASGNENFLEPTIGIRQIFHVRSAYEMADQLSTCTGDKWLEEEAITFPSRGNNWADWTGISVYNNGNNFYNVIPLNYVYKDYWTYEGANLVRVGDSGWTIYAEVVDDEATGITIMSTNASGYLANSVGVFSESGEDRCRDASRFIQFAYPTGGIIPNMENVSRRKATIKVYLKKGDTKYNIKKFTVYFQNDTEPLPYYEILEHPESTRSDEYLRAYTGNLHARMHFDTSYIRAFDPNDGSGNGNSATYYQYPLEFSQTAYGYYHPDAEYVEWSEYGIRIHGGTASSWTNSKGNGNGNPLSEGTTYLRALYNYKALQNQDASASTRLQQTRYAYENCSRDDAHSERKARAYAEAQQLAAASAEDIEAASANLQTAYDRSYCIYADVSEQPGQIARIVVPDKLCMGTQIYCTAWVGCATAVNARSPYPVSAIFRFRGVNYNNKGEEELTTLYSYCPGQISNIAVSSGRELVAGRQEQKPDGSNYYQAIWQQVYFTFTNKYGNDAFDHFVLEIDNNSKGSGGSDLYFDDVRIYTQKPVVKVENAAPICAHEMNVVRIATDYDSFITAVEGAVPEASDAKREYVGIYSFLDNQVYQETLEATKSETYPNGNYQEAFDAALIGKKNRSDCMAADGVTFFPEMYAYHHIKFHNHYEDHAPILYHQLATNERLETAGRMDYTDENGNIISRKLVFNCNLMDERLKGAEYLIVFQQKELTDEQTPQQIIDGISNAADFYGLDSPCGIVDKLQTVLATRAEVDFNNDLDPSTLTFCEGTNPSISLTGYSYDYNGKIQAIKDQYYDWYYGTLNEFNNEYVYVGDDTDDRDVQWKDEERIGTKDFCMYHLLLNFRHFYPDATEKQVNDGTVTAQAYSQDPKSGNEFEFTQHMLNKLKQWIAPDEQTGLQKLYLHKISVVLPSSDALQTVLAVQIGESYRYEDDDPEHLRPIIYCMEPVEIKYSTTLKSPKSHVGMSEVNYDETPFRRNDLDEAMSLPVRITASMVEAMTQGKELRIPLRSMRPSGFYRTPDATNADVRFIRNDQHYDITIRQTNDPQWQQFVTTEGGPMHPIIGQIHGIEAKSSRLKSLREILRDLLKNHGLKPEDNDYTEYIRISFKPDMPNPDDTENPLFPKFQPREGYYYILSVPYLEQLVEGEVLDPKHKITDDYGNVLSKPCEGNLLIPLKIVPEYAVWTGIVNSDWNNERNWRRADYRELVPSENQNTAADPFSTYASNTNTGDKGSQVKDGEYNGAPELKILAGTDFADRDLYTPTEIYSEGDGGYTYAPMYTTSVIIPSKDITRFPALINHSKTDEQLLNIVDGKDDAPTTSTPWIRYDMVASDHGDYYSVVKYYENTVKDITFQPGAAMYGAEYLNYEKAWVEYEMNTNRWYTAASPLQNTYSGDWYSPTATGDETGKQLTPQFQNITYSIDLNDRFAPAYYQRSWDKGTANLYQCQSEDLSNSYYGSDVVNAATKLDWSKVYNDVMVDYSNGGFCVKPVLSGGADGKVLVRMPKEDDSYLYYHAGNEHGGEATSITRTEGHHKLNSDKLKTASAFTQTITNDNGSLYYLVANPFMAPMDMAKFFAANGQFESGKFWVLTDDKQGVSVQNAADGTWSTSGTVAPCQSFFVKSKSSTDGPVSVTYTAAMQADPTTVVPATDNVLRIVAHNAKGEALSEAYVRVNENEDENGPMAELLLDSNLSDHVATVYTGADGTAMQYNSVAPQAKRIPLGIIAPEEQATTIAFPGSEYVSQHFALYDALENTTEPLTSDLTISVTGNSLGRYFIINLDVNEDEDENEDGAEGDRYDLQGIRVNTTQHGQIYIQNRQRLIK